MHHEESFWSDPRSFVALAFVIFFVIFGRKIWGVLTGMLDKRADEVRAELAEAQRLRQEAEAMLRSANQQREAAITDAQALLAGAKSEATRLANAAAADAEASAKRREQMAMDRIAAAEKAAIDDVRMIAADVATTAAREIIRNGLSAEADAALVDRAITGLPAALRAA
ncbi:MAG: F0F1 ATP synthase subunit B [Acetobacteraceae bacterium]|nr:F0F1 ATP synthase subunit B [Acetobacteraceae bacterium]